MKSFKVLMGLFLALPMHAQFGDWSSIYDTNKLEREKQRLEYRLQELVLKGIRPNLTRDQATKLSAVRVESPLVGTNLSPVDFYSDDRRVYMPVISLVFVEDICTAYAWLWANRYSLETIEEYIAMLRFRRPEAFEGRRYPSPLRALRVPDRALDDHKVNDMSLRLRNTAYAFILGHEFGHIYYRHPGYGPEVKRVQARENEEVADLFALDVMRRSREVPMGGMLFFQAALYFFPNRGNFQTNAQWQAYMNEEATHPMTTQRLKTLAANLDETAGDYANGKPNPAAELAAVRSIAAKFATFADWLANAEFQRVWAARAAKTDLSALAPRR